MVEVALQEQWNHNEYSKREKDVFIGQAKNIMLGPSMCFGCVDLLKMTMVKP